MARAVGGWKIRLCACGAMLHRGVTDVQRGGYSALRVVQCSVQEITGQQISCGAGHRFSWPAEFEHGAQTTNNDRLHCYMLKSLRAATIFSCGFSFEIIDLLEAGLRRSQDYDNHGPGIGCHVVTVRAGNLVEDPMRSQHADFPADRRGTATLFLRGLCRLGIQDRLQIAIAETVDQEFAVVDGFQ